MDESLKKVYSSLSNLCSKQECCSRDIYRKALRKLDGDEQGAAEVVAELVREKYVDDFRYASAFAREKSSITGWGPVKIIYALAAKGIDRSIAQEALGEIDSDRADEKLLKVVTAKAKALEGDPQARLKLIKFALTRGYEYSQIENLLRNFKL